MSEHLGAVSLKKSHVIVILLFFNIVKDQANGIFSNTVSTSLEDALIFHTQLFGCWT